MSSKPTLSRRTILGAALAAPVVISGCATQSRESDSLPLVRTQDPVARAVAYYENTKDVESDNPLATTHAVNQKCLNCVHLREQVDANRYICGTFPGRTVSPSGWCSIWAPQNS